MFATKSVLGVTAFTGRAVQQRVSARGHPGPQRARERI